MKRKETGKKSVSKRRKKREDFPPQKGT